jgi:hypothetical protein
MRCDSWASLLARILASLCPGHKPKARATTSKKEKEKKKRIITKRVAKLGTITNRVVIRIVEKCARAQFTTTWTPTTIKEVGDKFQQNFQADL